MLELSFIREAEQTDLILGESLIYESIRIPYGKRTYVVDFLVNHNNKKYLVEIKPTARTQTKNFKSKARAAISYAEENDMAYIVVTEEDIGHVISFEEARNIPDIEWGVKAIRRMKRDDNKKQRNSSRNRRNRKNSDS